MLTDVALTSLLAKEHLTRKDKMLLVLACSEGQTRKVSEITEKALFCGFRAVKKWNVSDILSAAGGLAVRVPDGWTLTEDGKKYLTEAGYLNYDQELVDVVTDLRKALAKIGHQATVEFVTEAIECFERELYRAAVVLSWVGAVSLFYHDIVENYLSAFNTEATRRDPKWRAAANTDDLARMKEYTFLELLEALSIIGKNVKQELQGCLMLRNGCGHPSSLKIGKRKVAAHLEMLVLNVFSKY